uniref:Uncharacterized protein n=1 Tax=Acrobeloides nanus TaxID=290746 RepID=A0A914C3H1_9BILA
MYERGTGKREIGRLLGIDESRKLSGFHLSRPSLAQPSRRMASEFTGLEPSRLLHLVDSRRKSMLEATPELGIVQKALKKTWKEINLETLIKTVDDFPKRLEACIAANGGYFE